MSMSHSPSSRLRSPRTIMLNAFAAAALAALLGGCEHTQDVAEAPVAPNDYRLRHPIAIKEGARTVELFIGSARGSLTPVQRADIANFAQQWKREATGGVIIGVPVGGRNAVAARDTVPEIQSLLVAAGVAPGAIRVQQERLADPGRLGTVRLIYPKMVATAGPCGLWPEDLGPAPGRTYRENRPYYNFGCANQRNLAAMIDNPADLVQPRSETAAYTVRRNAAFEKYRKGEPTTTNYPEAEKAKLSDTGK